MTLLFTHQLHPFHHLKKGNRQIHKHSQEGLPHFIEEITVSPIYSLCQCQSPIIVTILFCHADACTSFFSTLKAPDKLGIDVFTYSYSISSIYYPMQDWGSVVVNPNQVIFKDHSGFLQHKTSITLLDFSDSPSFSWFLRKWIEIHLRKKAGK